MNEFQRYETQCDISVVYIAACAKTQCKIIVGIWIWRVLMKPVLVIDFRGLWWNQGEISVGVWFQRFVMKSSVKPALVCEVRDLWWNSNVTSVLLYELRCVMKPNVKSVLELKIYRTKKLGLINLCLLLVWCDWINVKSVLVYELRDMWWNPMSN